MLGPYFGATALLPYGGLNLWVTALGAGIAVSGDRRSVLAAGADPTEDHIRSAGAVTLGMSFIISDACSCSGEAIQYRTDAAKRCFSNRRRGSLASYFRLSRLVLVEWAIRWPRSDCISCWSGRG